MKTQLLGYNRQTRIFLFVLALGAVGAFGLAVFQSLTFSPSQFLALAVASVVTVIASLHRLRLPKTDILLSSGELLIFWGVIWLGVSGGIFLALLSITTKTFFYETVKKSHSAIRICLGVLASFAAGEMFYTILHFNGFDAAVLAARDLPFADFLIALLLMTFAYYAVTIFLGSLFIKLEGGSVLSYHLKDKMPKLAVSYFVAMISAALLHLAFLKFDLPFGWVILAGAIFTHLTYRMHTTALTQKTSEIENASRIHLATVEVLATAIDARDQVGIGHVRRTQIYAIGIGEYLFLTEKEICALRTGALLHDIGKLAVPDHILNKPGRLTAAEIEKTKIHAVVGASILEKVNFDYPVVPTVKFHHEMWNGEGYPQGLKGEDIPLTARILAVADAYDTLRGARPYRKAVSREEARRFLIGGAGTQFDPKIVDIFLRNLRKFDSLIQEAGLDYQTDGKETLYNVLSEASDQNYVHEIKRANREVYALYELARVFGASLTLPETLKLLTEKIGELVPFDTCAVYLLDPKGIEAAAVHVAGTHHKALKGKKIKPGEGATGFVLRKKEPIFDIEPGLDFIFDHTELGDEYTAIISLPLIAGDKLLGAVSLYSSALEKYEEEHQRLLETIAPIGADAIDKSVQHAESETRALTDPMTNLPNARSLQIQFDHEVARANRKANVFQVLMLDLDGFKAVNDTFGHKIGDMMLKKISAVLRDQLRDYDFLARYAGDEFVAIIPETSGEEVLELCERMEKAVKSFRLPVENERFAAVGISIGAAAYPHQGETLEKVLIAADKAMYATKAAHKQAGSKPADELVIDEAVKDIFNENFIVELDQSHIVSSAIN